MLDSKQAKKRERPRERQGEREPGLDRVEYIQHGPATPGAADPLVNLAAAVCVQALIEVQSDDPSSFVDALAWLVLDPIAPLALDVLGYDVADGCDVLERVLRL